MCSCGWGKGYVWKEREALSVTLREDSLGKDRGAGQNARREMMSNSLEQLKIRRAPMTVSERRTSASNCSRPFILWRVYGVR